MRHWCQHYIGLPWESGEQDCWGLVRRVYREQYGRDLSVIDVDANNRAAVHAVFQTTAEFGKWREVPTPAEGDCIVAYKGNVADHVGLWVDVDGGKMLHAVPHSGVVLSRLDALRRLGWNPRHFYRYVGA